MNETLKRIKQNIVDPEMQKLRNTVVGYVAAVYYDQHTCDVVFIDKNGMRRKKKGLTFPLETAGVYSESLKPGDKVELSFRNQSMTNLYISMIYKKERKKTEHVISHGQSLPISTDLF